MPPLNKPLQLAPNQLLDLCIVTYGIFPAPQCPEGKGAIVIRVPVMGIDEDGLCIGLYGCFELPQIGEREPEIVVSVTVCLVQCQRLTIILNRPCWVSQTAIRDAPVVVGNRVVRGQLERTRVVVSCQVEATLIEVGVPAQKIHARIPWVGIELCR